MILDSKMLLNLLQKIMKQYDAMGVYKKGHYHRLNRSNNIVSWNTQVWACLCPIKITGSLFHTHYTFQFPFTLYKNFFSEATHTSILWNKNVSFWRTFQISDCFGIKHLKVWSYRNVTKAWPCLKLKLSKPESPEDYPITEQGDTKGGATLSYVFYLPKHDIFFFLINLQRSN